MRKILLVEDEDILRDTYQLILSSEPYDIHVAANGQEAIELCKNLAFDLILLDLMMPIMNGVQFLEAFQPGHNAQTKIIIISNLSGGDMLSRALKLGAHRNVMKADMSPKQLLAMVRYEVDAV